MFTLTVRGLRSHLLRLGATALAVVLGVSFMVGTTVLGDTVKAGFDEAFADVNLGVDAVVRSDREIPTPFGAERVRIDATVVQQLSGEPNVAAVAGQVRRPIRLIDTAGEPIGNPNAGPPTFGLNWSEVPDLNNWDLVAGAAPTPGTLVLDRRTATDANISVGDSIGVDIASGTRQFTVSGIATFGEIDNFAGAPAALLSTAEAQELLAEPGTFDWITVAGANGIDQAELVAGLSGSLPDGTEAITGEAFSDESAGPFRDFINQFTTFITAFGVIALFVGGFIIFNTFAVLVAQRMRELALLRAVGASRGQVLGSVLGEAALVGVVASAIGAVAGVALAAGLRQLLDALGLELPPRPLALESAAFILPVTLGIVITVLSALLPALRASRVAPVEAMGAAAIDTSARSTPRLVVGAIAAVGAGVMVAIGWSAEPTRALQLIGAGLVATFVAVTALGPLYLRPLAGFIGAPLRAITGITGQLATENARRNPARTSSTTAALTIGIGLVTVIAIAAASASASVASATQRSFTSDLIVTPDSFLGLSPQVAEDIDALDEVDVATGLRFTFAGVDQPSIGPQGDPAVPDGGDPTLGLGDLRGATVLGIQPDRIDGLVDFEVTSGSLDDLTGATVAVSADEASKLGVGVGDQVTLSFQATGEQSFTVVGGLRREPVASRWRLHHLARDVRCQRAARQQGRPAGADRVRPRGGPHRGSPGSGTSGCRLPHRRGCRPRRPHRQPCRPGRPERGVAVRLACAVAVHRPHRRGEHAVAGGVRANQGDRSAAGGGHQGPPDRGDDRAGSHGDRHRGHRAGPGHRARVRRGVVRGADTGRTHLQRAVHPGRQPGGHRDHGHGGRSDGRAVPGVAGQSSGGPRRHRHRMTAVAHQAPAGSQTPTGSSAPARATTSHHHQEQ